MTEHEADYAREREAEARAGEREAKRAEAQPDEEITLEMARQVTCQSTAAVQCALNEFWAQCGRRPNRCLDALRRRINGATEDALREYFGGSAGFSDEPPTLIRACERAFGALDALCSSFAGQEGRHADECYETARTARDAVDQALTKAKGETP